MHLWLVVLCARENRVNDMLAGQVASSCADAAAHIASFVLFEFISDALASDHDHFEAYLRPLRRVLQLLIGPINDGSALLLVNDTLLYRNDSSFDSNFKVV